jgi:hypothetical protein
MSQDVSSCVTIKKLDWDVSNHSFVNIYVLEDEKGKASTVTSDIHVNLPKKRMFPQLGLYGADSDTVEFQQDDMTSCTAQQSISTLRAVFGN